MRILYIQHAGALGGSVLSLKYLVEGMIDRGHTVSVALVEPNKTVSDLYEACGATVYLTPELPLIRHTTAGWAHALAPRACVYQMAALAAWKRTTRVLANLIASTRADIIHLNSVTLALCARVLRTNAPPTIWHVRESPTNGYMGVRRNLIRNELLHSATQIIFLSEYDKESWISGKRGVVIPNIPNSKLQVPTPQQISQAKQRFGITEEHTAIAYLGGASEIKGVFPLIKAVEVLSHERPNIRVLAPGMLHTPTQSWKAKTARYILKKARVMRDFERAPKLIQRHGLQEIIKQSAFVDNIGPVISACDFLVFPSIRPHFARPVIEAAVLAKPSIGSNLGGVRDLIKDGETGLTIPAGDHNRLAQAMSTLLSDTPLCERLGQNARRYLEPLSDPTLHFEKILSLYKQALRCTTS